MPDFYSGNEKVKSEFLSSFISAYGGGGKSFQDTLKKFDPAQVSPYVTELFKSLKKNVFKKSSLKECLNEYALFKKTFHWTYRQHVLEGFVDVLVSKEHFELAFEEWKSIQIEVGESRQQEWSYNLSTAIRRFTQFEYLLKKPLICGNDIYRMAYSSSRLTDFGEKNREEIFSVVDGLLLSDSPYGFFHDVYEDYQFQTPIKKLRPRIPTEYRKYISPTEFKNSNLNYQITQSGRLTKWAISLVVTKKCSVLLRKAENKFRLKIGGKKVGESWISETELFYQLKKTFPELRVMQHGRPKFLGRQHFDVWIPDLAIAIEYQGKQHDMPIEFFGGEEGFQKNLERDLRKKNVARENGIDLIEVRPGYSLEQLINRINEIRRRRLSREK